MHLWRVGLFFATFVKENAGIFEKSFKNKEKIHKIVLT